MSSSATLPLSKLREGQKGQVSDLLLSGEMRRRLQDLGLIPGTCVSCLYQSAFGDPVRILSAEPLLLCGKPIPKKF